MTFEIVVNIMPIAGLLDPQGKSVAQGLNNIGLKAVKDARVGKHIHLKLEANSAEEAKTLAEQACKKLLVNAVMESYEISILNPA